MRKIIVIFVISILGLTSVKSQSIVNQYNDSLDMSIHNRFYLSLYGGLAQFYGDVSSDVYFPGTSMKGKIPWVISPRVGWDFNSRFGLRADWTMNSVWGKSNKPGQDRYFHASVNDIQGHLIVNMTNIVFPYKYNKRWNMTAYVGAGWMFYNSIARNSNDSILHVTGYDMNGDKTERSTNRVWSVGLSGAYKLTKHLDISLEIKMNNSPVDDLDAWVVGLSEFDNYSSVMLGLNYYFGTKDNAWKWNPLEPLVGEMIDSLESYDKQLVDLGNDVKDLKACCEATSSLPDSPDEDADGVPDTRDLEPKTPKGNTVNWQGVTIMPNNPSKVPLNNPTDFADDDNDGVPNIRDIEPNTPANTMVNWQGVTIPVGGSGSSVGGAGIVGGGGSPKVGMYFNSVYFPFDQSTIDQANYQEIIKVVMYLRANPGTRIKISGNTDERGTNSYNDALSDRRVKAVKKVLLEDFGFDESIFDEEALGETKLFSQNTHWVNRRVDFFIVK